MILLSTILQMMMKSLMTWVINVSFFSDVMPALTKHFLFALIWE